MKKKLMIIAPQFEPIPLDIGGVEGLITDFINENEHQKRCEIFVVSKEDKRDHKFNFYHTKFFYAFDGINCSTFKQKRIYRKFKTIKFLRKILFNKFTYLMFKTKKYAFEDLNFFGFLCKEFYKMIQPDAVIVFGYDKIHHLWPIVKKCGNSNIYYHLHYCRDEDLKLRNLIPNSIATSHYVFNKWNKTKIHGEKSIVIRHGVDFKKFNYSYKAEQINRKRELLGFKENDFVVIFTGRFRPGKGVLQLLKAFSLLNNDNIKLLMLGEFDSNRHKDEDDFETEVLKLIKTNKNVVRLGFVPNSDLSLYYACANVQVVPTVYEEAAGLVTIEGMLAGLPIIITKSGGMPEYVDDGCSIKLDINENLSSELAESILRLYNNRNLCKEMSKVSKVSALEFSISKYYERMIDFVFGENNE